MLANTITESLIALRASAQSGCDLCSLVWVTWDETRVAINGSSATEEDLSGYFSGPLYVDIDSWQEGTDGRPEFIFSVYSPHTRRGHSSKRQYVCTLELYAIRGNRAKLIAACITTKPN